MTTPFLIGRRPIDEGPLVFANAESPEAREHLQEMCEGKMIARVCWELNEDLPVGASAFGLEFETGERLIIMALPVTRGAWLARLVWRWFERQQQWTKGMKRHFGTDRVSAGEAPPDFLQRQIEGQVVRGIRQPKDHLGLGERLDMELRDGSVVIIEAVPTVDGPRAGQHCDLEIRRERRERYISA